MSFECFGSSLVSLSTYIVFLFLFINLIHFLIKNHIFSFRSINLHLCGSATFSRDICFFFVIKMKI